RLRFHLNFHAHERYGYASLFANKGRNLLLGSTGRWHRSPVVSGRWPEKGNDRVLGLPIRVWPAAPAEVGLQASRASGLCSPALNALAAHIHRMHLRNAKPVRNLAIIFAIEDRKVGQLPRLE